VATTISTLARTAYIYGYPLVTGVGAAIRLSSPESGLVAPVNTFAHARELMGAENKFVSVNTDTLYSIAQCDVSEEPLVLHVPDAGDRYYVMQLIDAWTNNFAYVGRRATGTAEGSFLVAGPGWSGPVPDGLRVIHSPTTVFSIVGRFAVDGEADAPAVHALQERTWLTPLSRHPGPPDVSSRRPGDWDLAPWDRRAAEELVFWEKLRSWMRRFPPPPADQPFVQVLERLGLLADQSPYVDPDPELAAMLVAGRADAEQFIEGLVGKGETVNGWWVRRDVFNYNLDHLELGTIDAPEWRIAERRMAYLVRALAARSGLWGNHGYEALYPVVYIDGHGEQLNGGSRYAIHFDQPPPVDGLWSITTYDLQNNLVANSLGRYSLGSRTPGLRCNADGSLDLLLQQESPGPELESNWLPVPATDFRTLMRLYQPRPEILSGEYVLPPVTRVG
jgi:hypothetical protein